MLSCKILFLPCHFSLKYYNIFSLKFHKMALYFLNLSCCNINSQTMLDYTLSCEIPKVQCYFVEFLLKFATHSPFENVRVYHVEYPFIKRI